MPALTDVVTGQIQFMMIDLAVAVPMIREGKVIAYGVTTPTRVKATPELVTAVRGSVDFLEDFLRHIEILTLHVVETRQRSSRSGISTPHTRIGRRARGRAAGVVILPAAPRISGHRVRVRDCICRVGVCGSHACSRV